MHINKVKDIEKYSEEQFKYSKEKEAAGTQRIA